ncbi:MAG: 16S rRNA (cytidine(1402)-2'-O)-methyltransferase [Woeseiaceae bacterium]|nr:16S rRNA (cytidine(1402)-2'-O)-methyltransferase [Woeseiaceae bacterium]
MTESTLFVVATPLGNLDDLSPRARQVLDQVDLIAAEDTRRSRRLLSHFGINTRQISLHEHNEAAVVAKLIDKLLAGQNVALISDAGTPLISDPGYRLLKAAHQENVRVSPIPGPSAVVAALSVAGLPTDRFCFEGFLPAKKNARRERLGELADETRTVVLFEATHRFADCVADLVAVFGPDRQAFVAREISKLHEQCVSATLAELAQLTERGQIELKGEFVVAVEGREAVAGRRESVDVEELLRALAAMMPGRQAAELAAKLTGRGRNEMYRLMLDIKGDTASD